jgi:ABC-type transport system substrate-binding protein
VLLSCHDSSPEEQAGEMVLHHYFPSKIKSFDPVLVQDEYTLNVCSQIFERLYQYHYLKRPYVLIPLLADGMPEFSEDKLMCTVKIKKGVYFQDDVCFPNGRGRELKAEDFVYSLKRTADIKNLSPNWSGFEDKIVGLDEFREYTKSCKTAADVDYSRPIEGLQTPDDYTLIIKLKRPWPQLVDNMMAGVRYAPVAREAVEYYRKDIVSHPVGTGPFILKEWKRGSYIELVRNPNFRGEPYPSEGNPGDAEAGMLDDAGKMIPFADRIVWRIIEEEQPAWFLFLQGELDGKAIPKDNWGEAIAGPGELTEKMKRLNIRLEKILDASVFFLGFNMQDPVLGRNKPLRQAISYSIDREGFIRTFFNGIHDVAHGIIPPIMPDYDPNIKQLGYANYDPNKARQLVREAEKIYGGKIPTLKIAFQGTGSFYRQFGQFIKRNIEAVGLKIELDLMDWPTFQEKVNSADVQIFATGGGAGIPDSQDFLTMFYSKYKAPGPNQFNYVNLEFDRLFELTSVMGDSPERRRLYQKMERIALEDCPAAFLNHRVGYVLIHDWYKNYRYHIFQYGLSKYHKIDMDKQAAYKELLKKVK